MGVLSLEQFATIFMLTFALFMVIAGVFTTYFGSGKSRKIGAGLMVGGLILGVLWIIISTWFMGEPMLPLGQEFKDLIWQSLSVVAAAALGALAAIGIFLLSIMKS